MDYTAVYTCPFCGEENELFVEPEDGAEQILTEDCSVCCRPIDITVRIVNDEVIADTAANT
jgi:hypothetical protein